LFYPSLVNPRPILTYVDAKNRIGKLKNRI